METGRIHFFPPNHLPEWFARGRRSSKGEFWRCLEQTMNEVNSQVTPRKRSRKPRTRCSSQPQGLRWALGRGIFPQFMHKKKGPRAGRPERNRRLFQLLKSLQFWECWKQPPGKSQRHPEGCGRNYCQETEVPSTQGAVHRPGQVAARGSWYRLNMFLRRQQGPGTASV